MLVSLSAVSSRSWRPIQFRISKLPPSRPTLAPAQSPCTQGGVTYAAGDKFGLTLQMDRPRGDLGLFDVVATEVV